MSGAYCTYYKSALTPVKGLTGRFKTQDGVVHNCMRGRRKGRNKGKPCAYFIGW